MAIRCSLSSDSAVFVVFDCLSKERSSFRSLTQILKIKSEMIINFEKKGETARQIYRKAVAIITISCTAITQRYSIAVFVAERDSTAPHNRHFSWVLLSMGPLRSSL